MASTQKVILIILFLNLLIGFVADYSISTNDGVRGGYTEYEGKLAQFITAQETRQQADEDEGEQGWFQKFIGVTADFAEGVFDIAKLVGQFIWIFVKSLIPWNLLPDGVSLDDISIVEYIMVRAIQLLRTTLLILIAFEAFLVFRNRKTGA